MMSGLFGKSSPPPPAPTPTPPPAMPMPDMNSPAAMAARQKMMADAKMGGRSSTQLTQSAAQAAGTTAGANYAGAKLGA